MNPMVIFLVGALIIPNVTLAKRDKGKDKSETQENAVASDPDAMAFKTIVDEIQTGVRVVQAENLAMGRGTGFPSRLDAQTDGPCVKCFSLVTSAALNDPRWVKKGNTYRFSGAAFNGEFTYDPASGMVRVASL